MKEFDRERCFEVDGIHYVVGLNLRWELYLFIDVIKSGIYIPTTKLERQFGDEPETRIWGAYPAKRVFKVKQEVARYIEQAIRFYKPGHFTFAANEAHKEALYRRFAHKIANQHGYFLQETHKGCFEFYRVNEFVEANAA